MLVYPSSMTLSTRHLTLVSDALRRHRQEIGTRWRLLNCGQQALMVLARLRKGETYRDLAGGFGVGVTTAYRYLREGLKVLAAKAPTLPETMPVARRKAYVTIDGTLVRIDRVATASGNDRAYYSGKHKGHGVNVPVIADPAGRLIWASPPVPGARHDCRAAAEHGIPDALARAGATAYADSAYHGLGPTIRAPFRKVRYDRATDRFVSRPLSRGTKAANRAHPALRAPGERANTDPKN